MWIKHILYVFCHACDRSSLGNWVRTNRFAFPSIEIFHLLGLATLGGMVLLVNLRLLGVRLFQEEPVSELAGDVWPLFLGALCVMIASGYLLFSSEGVRMYANWGFWVKMSTLLVAIIYTFTIHRKVVFAEESSISPAGRRAVAIISLLLWFTVGLAGRSLGYIG